jgi:transcriptional regulator with XRE-family HTH domain
MDTSHRHYLPQPLAYVLWRRREARGWTQRDVASRVGIDRAYLAHLEAGRRAPSRSVAEALIAVLALPADLAEQLRSAAVPNAGRDWPGRAGLRRDSLR